MSIAAIPALIMAAAIIAVPFVILFYVYRDARRRGMNAVLWALVAAVAPALIGLIVYLLVRGNYSDLRCPKCGAPVREDFVICPQCGTKLRPACPACVAPVEPDWKVCPRCTKPLTDIPTDVQAPVRAKDSSVWKVLAVVILVPVLLIALLGLSFSVHTVSGASSFAEDTFDSYFQYMDEEGAPGRHTAAEVHEWLDTHELKLGHAYALRYERPEGDRTEYFYLVYVPGAGHQTYSGLGQSGSIFGTKLTMDLHSTGEEESLFQIASCSDTAPKLKITLDGKQIPCEVTQVDFNPTRFYAEN